MGSCSNTTCLKPANSPARLVASDCNAEKNAGIVITAAMVEKSGYLRLTASFRLIKISADISSGVIDLSILSK